MWVGGEFGRKMGDIGSNMHENKEIWDKIASLVMKKINKMRGWGGLTLFHSGSEYTLFHWGRGKYPLSKICNTHTVGLNFA